jgi:4-amino-4-deoxy-L-arabinose transferase-like glycosyltransferase
MYNLSRIELALRGGLFNNGLFTSVFQLMWPWGFDAVHLPFIELGWGYALPSLACLGGTCAVVFLMTRERLGADAAWVALVALLALPCLVYQATSTKNDIPILLAGAVWIYARRRWRREGRASHVFWMVLSIGFMAGSKTTGLAYGAVLALATLWEVRAWPVLLRRTAAGLAASFVLLGSLETYVESYRVFRHPFGPPATVRQLRNPDGIRGGMANLSRYVAGSVYLGQTPIGASAPNWLERSEAALLARAGLFNAGEDPRFSDRTLRFSQSGLEELSGFGPVGTLAMATVLASCVFWRPRSPWWRLSVAALAGLVIVSLCVAYSGWANRYLIPWYALATTALVWALWEGDSVPRRLARWGFLAAAAASAAAAPMVSFNRGPSALVASVTRREEMETCNYPLIGKVRERLRELRAASPGSNVYYVACDDSPVLPILEDPRLDAVVVTPQEFARLLSSGRVAAGDLEIEDFDTHSTRLTRIDRVTAPDAFAGRGLRSQEIFRVGVPDPQGGR